MTPEAADDTALLEQLAGELPEEELLILCGRLADRLLREGWTAEAARWRTLSLVPTGVADREPDLARARRRLEGPQSAGTVDLLTAADLPPAWRDLLEHLRIQPAAARSEEHTSELPVTL